jgi:hypothetical protein
MSIINNVERYMKRYDYLIDKRERKYNQGKRLSEQEDEELRKLRPNVFTPILTMFELLHDTIKTNQETRKTKKLQSGGANNPATKLATSVLAADVTAAAAAAAAIIEAQKKENSGSKQSVSDPPSTADADAEDDADAEEDADAEDAEAKRLSELEESLLPLLTKIIVYIEENKKATKKKDGEKEEEEEKYPDIGTTAKNSAILVVRRIKKWWNDLISGGTSDLSSKLNLKKAIPQLANNPGDMNNINMKAEELNKLAEEATDAIHKPLQKIERILSNDVRDIASSSVEGIMNALSLIPGIGTTLQLWRLLQNVIVIMSKSVTTMAGAKTEGVALKTGIMDIKNKLADPSAIANNAAGDAMSQAQGDMGAISGAPAPPQGPAPPQAQGLAPPQGPPQASAPAQAPAPAPESAQAPAQGPPQASAQAPAPESAQAPAPAPAPAPAQAPAPESAPEQVQYGGSNNSNVRPKANHLRSIKKYKREYKQSLREIKKTRKNILRMIKNMI